MPVDTRHPLYAASLDHWKRCRDVYEGEDAVKGRGQAYLPKPGGLSGAEYAAYLARALFYSAVGRTVDGFVGAIARKDPVVNVPDRLTPMLTNVTADGLSLAELVKTLCSEIILQGRGGLLVDMDDATQRPFLSFYTAEAIINWADNCIVLHETVYERNSDDTFKQVPVEQYRQLSLIDGVYTVSLWRKVEGAQIGNEWAVYDTIVPTRRGAKLDVIPFFWLTPLGKTSRVEKPPLLGLVSVCLAHYRNSADYEHGLHFTGLPTLYATGMSRDADNPIQVGSLAVICIEEANAKVAYAEVRGDFKGLESAMKSKEEKMAVLGASVFHDNPKGVEAAETARIRTSGETSLLSGVVTAVEETIEAALKFAAHWIGAEGPVQITLNREFVDTRLDGATLTGLVAAFQSGALSLSQFLYNMQQGDLLAPDTDLLAEAATIEAGRKVQEVRNVR